MSNVFKYASECNSLYGVISILIVCVLLVILGILIYKAIIFLIDKVTKYKEVYAKAKAGEISIEAELHE